MQILMEMGQGEAVAAGPPFQGDGTGRVVNGKDFEMCTERTSDTVRSGLFSLLCVSQYRIYSNSYIPKSCSK